MALVKACKGLAGWEGQTAHPYTKEFQHCILFDSISHPVGAHLVFVFDDVGVDLVQRRHAVELAEVQTGLLC